MRRGFTLIEILVVLLIFALLTAMFMPSLAMARASARCGRCASNLKQLANLHFDQSMDGDEWAGSAYDLRGEWANAAIGTGPEPGDDEQRSRFNGGRQRGDWDGWEWRIHQAENDAPGQPPYWLLPCPEAVPVNEQSYGMNYWMRGVKPERLVPGDLVFACSPYRLIVQGRDIRRRHGDGVNFMYGDGHISHGDESAIPERPLFRNLRRDDPLPALYPDR